MFLAPNVAVLRGTRNVPQRAEREMDIPVYAAVMIVKPLPKQPTSVSLNRLKAHLKKRDLIDSSQWHLLPPMMRTI